jgi:DNA-binding Lrp family transcriptional regulator
MMQRFFVFVQAEPGKAYKLGLALAKIQIEQVKEINSISGKWDILLRVEIDNRRDISQDVISKLFELPHIRKTKTIVAYAVYDPAACTLDDDFD